MKRTAPPSYALLAVGLLGLGACAVDDDLGEAELLLADLPTVQMLPSVVGDTAIALTITNTSVDRRVSCRAAAFRAPIQILDHCGEGPLSNEFIDVAPLTLAAGQVKRWAATADANAGGLLGADHLAAVAAERTLQGFGDEDLVYCPLGGTERVLDCGYTCTQGSTEHLYGDDWTVTNTAGGWRKHRCLANGTIDSYETRCVGDVQVGTTRRTPGGPGTTLVSVCQPDATFLTTAECSAGYQQTLDRQSCEEAWCGATAPGGELLIERKEHGRLVATCRFGQADSNSQRAVCNTDYVPNPTNTDCVPRPKRDCGPGRPDGWFQVVEACMGAYKGRYRETCNDGALRISDSRLLSPRQLCDHEL